MKTILWLLTAAAAMAQTRSTPPVPSYEVHRAPSAAAIDDKLDEPARAAAGTIELKFQKGFRASDSRVFKKLFLKGLAAEAWNLYDSHGLVGLGTPPGFARLGACSRSQKGNDTSR